MDPVPSQLTMLSLQKTTRRWGKKVTGIIIHEHVQASV